MAEKVDGGKKKLLDEAVDEDGKSTAAIWLVLGLDKLADKKQVKPIRLYTSFLFELSLHLLEPSLSLGRVPMMSSPVYASSLRILTASTRI